MNSDTKQLYKHYRAAMMVGNLEEAYQHIQDIYESDPNDDNALAEIIKHQERILANFSPELEQALLEHNEKNILSILQEVDKLATPHLREANIPSYTNAKVAERKIILQEKKALASKTLEQIDPDTTNWKEIEEKLNSIAELMSSYQFQLDEEESSTYNSLKRTLKKRNDDVADKEYFDKTLQQLLKIASEVETISLTNQDLPQSQLIQEQEEFIRLWKRIENKKYPIEKSDMARLSIATQFYEDGILTYKKAKRAKRIIIASILIFICTIVSIFVLSYTQASSYATELSQLQSQGQTQAATQMLSQLEEEHSALLRFPVLSSQLLNTQAWLEKKQTEYELFKERLTSLEEACKNNFENITMQSVQLRITGLETSLAKLPKDLQEQHRQKLSELQNRHQIRVAQARTENLNESNKTLLFLQRQIETIQEQKLSTQELNSQSKALLEVLDGKLLEMKENREVLNIPDSTMNQMSNLQKMLEKQKEDTQAILDLPAQLESIDKLDAFKTTIDSLSNNQVPVGLAAFKLAQQYPTPQACLSTMFLNGRLSAADDFYNNPSLLLPFPEQASQEDLRMLREVATYKGWVDAYKIQQSRAPQTLWSTKPVDIPKDAEWLIGLYASPPPFVGRAKNQEISGASFLSCSLIAVAALPDKIRFFRFLDDKTGNYQESLLYTLPAITSFQQQGNNALALAYLWKQLATIIQARPKEHGAHLSPSLQADLASFKKTEDETKFPLKQGCWWNTNGDTQAAQKKWEQWMKTHSGATYVKEAKDTLILMKQLTLLGPKVIGYIDGDGKACLNKKLSSQNPSWYINAKTDKLTPFDPDELTDTIPFSPILSY